MSAKQREQIQRLQRQFAIVESALSFAACTCRGPGRPLVSTDFHTIEELEVILYIPCPVHKYRNPGIVRQIFGHSVPLRKPDWPYCTCPPDIWRDYAMGRRPMPTEEESELHRYDWYGPWLEDAKYTMANPEQAKKDLQKYNQRIREIKEEFFRKAIPYWQSNGY